MSDSGKGEHLGKRFDFSLEFLIAMFRTALGKFKDVGRILWHMQTRIAERRAPLRADVIRSDFFTAEHKSWQTRNMARKEKQTAHAAKLAAETGL